MTERNKERKEGKGGRKKERRGEDRRGEERKGKYEFRSFSFMPGLPVDKPSLEGGF